ncbi:copper amine oxidase [Halobacillus shinanisalinarum]|uniref:Copper amine oxidase n=1 Tax=Halobacillus shinanisalinarum TaxID=2932258 RepID=A0ABY4GU72_9BACI|nr:copper amine oxidase [Halobacillus shinanisalinarum]UOQ91707.1 copper amine oxidase [Halobacillus shinanisalinarum]
MDMKKALFAVPLSVSLLLPTSLDVVNAEEHNMPTVETEAVELRASLDKLFSEHAYLAVETMRKGAEGAADFEASANALAANTEDLSAAIASVYGDEAGQKFQDMWSEHIGYFVDYVKATGSGDEEAKQMALDELDDYRKDFSQFISTATDGAVKAEGMAEGLQMHVNQLIGAFDAYVAGNYDEAYAKERQAIDHMYGVSKGMSKAIVNQFPDKFNNTKAVTPAADLRSNLNHLLSEHVGLATMAMQNGLDGSKDFKASAQSLANNTDDLTKAITSIYGEEAGNKFNQIWSDHIDDFVSYVEATANEDKEKQKEAMKELEDYRDNFAMFLEEATGGEVSAEKLAPSLQKHADYLFDTFDQYAAEDYEKTYTTLRDSYAHMFGASKALSGGIVSQFPDKFAMENMPSDMPKTGMGGTAANSDLWIFASILALVGAAGVFIRKQSKQQ